MRSVLAAVAAASVVLAISVTAWAGAPTGTPPVDATVQFGAVAQTASAVIEDKIYPVYESEVPQPLDLVQMTAGGRVTAFVDGVHQPLVYRVPSGETFDTALNRLDLRADEPGRRRMAGQDQFVAPVGVAEADRLTDADRDYGFRYLSDLKVPPANFSSDDSSPLGAGRYVLLCNVRVHYRNQAMHTNVDVTPNQTTP